MNNTVRKHPRTLHGSEGAFTSTADYASAIERPAPSLPIVRYVVALLAVLLIVHTLARFING